MSNIEKSIDVDVPVRTAYNQWTQFEEFPRFMEGVKEVRQLDDRRLDWRAEVGGKEKALGGRDHGADPGRAHRLAQPRAGRRTRGVVTFHRLDDDTRRASCFSSTTTPRASSRTSATPSASRPRASRRSGAIQGIHRAARPGDRRVARLDQCAALLNGAAEQEE